MDNMISVINDNLKNVVNGIKTHKGEITNALAKVKADMAEKSTFAEQLKSEVEESKNTISSLENEISTLENDLEELTAKFGDDFKETVAAGNKEINSKIIKDRAAISAESTKIEELTNRAKGIKDDLLNLKDKKEALEINLSDTSILEGYYKKRIEAIIDYSISHTTELDKFQDEDVNLDLVASLNDLTEHDFENNVDDNVFSEIADISDADLADIELEEDEYDFSDIASDDFEDEAFNVSKQLDEVIDNAKSLAEEIEEKADLMAEEIVEEPLIEPELDNEDEVEIEEQNVEEVEKKEEVNDEDVIDPDQEFVVPFDFTQIQPIENEIDIDVDDDLDETKIDESKLFGQEEKEEFIPETLSDEHKETIDNILTSINNASKEIVVEEEPIVLTLEDEDSDIEVTQVDEFDPLSSFDEEIEIKEFDPLNPFGEEKEVLISKEDIPEIPFNDDNDINLDEMPVYESSDNSDYYNETTRELADLVKGIQENEDIYNTTSIPEISDVIADSSIVDNENNIYGVIQNHGLFANSFNNADLEMMEAIVNTNEFEELFNVLDKHGIDSKILYKSAKVIEMNNSALVDNVLTELEKSDATSIDIETIFDKIEKVDLNELQRAVQNDDTEDLTGLLYKSMTPSSEDRISTMLELSKSESKKLKNNTTEEELKKINMFAELVVTNINTLKDKGVDKPVECFIEHPQRFLFNPSRLNEIFDKYDDADLVRCINKNSAVIDKL